MERILIIEDDAGISSFVAAELMHEGFETEIVENGRAAIDKFEGSPKKFDIILLDIMLPELSGLEVLRRIRKISAVPVILLTALGETYDKVNGLNAGADDYLAKPFEIEELLARIRSLLRRSAFNTEQVSKNNLEVRGLNLSVETMTAKICNVEISFSKTEFFLLKYFMENAGKVLSREKIINAVWGTDYYIEEKAVDVYVGYLRTKIDKALSESGEKLSGVDYITTVRGAGYVMKK